MRVENAQMNIKFEENCVNRSTELNQTEVNQLVRFGSLFEKY